MTTRRQKAFVNKDQVDTRILNVEQRTFAYEFFCQEMNMRNIC